MNRAYKYRLYPDGAQRTLEKQINLLNRMEQSEHPDAEYFNGTLTYLAAGEHIPEFVVECLSDTSLNEGIFKTYPIDKTVHYVKTLFGLNDNQIGVFDGAGGNPNVKRIVVKILDTEENNRAIDKAMNLCGYVRSTEMKIGDFAGINFISRYEERDITDEVRRMGHIRHITPLYNVEKIKRIGFIPKSSNSRFNYPDRIYFFGGDTPMIEIGYQILDFHKHNQSKGDKDIYAVISVDTGKIPDSCHFHYDPNYAMGIFTTDNIPPSAIDSIKEYSVRELKELYSGKYFF